MTWIRHDRRKAYLSSLEYAILGCIDRLRRSLPSLLIGKLCISLRKSDLIPLPIGLNPKTATAGEGP